MKLFSSTVLVLVAEKIPGAEINQQKKKAGFHSGF
jgi:hypothetical protein